jgi:hypothetical protein
MRPGRLSDPLGRGLPRIERAIRRFVLFVWRIRFGWVLVVATAAMLAAAGIGMLGPSSEMSSELGDVAFLMLGSAWLLVGLLFAMSRRALRGPTAQWDQLDAAGKAMRLAMTIAGTALLLAPFALLAWWALR